MVCPLIIRLRLPINPSAITRTIVAVRVDTVDCERFAVSVRRRLSVELREAIPLVAYPYAPFPIELVIRVVLSVTTSFKPAPYVVQSGMSVSVFLIRSVLIDYHSLAPNHL